MSILTIETKVTYRYLMGKTKHELSSWLLDALNEIERLREPERPATPRKEERL